MTECEWSRKGHATFAKTTLTVGVLWCYILAGCGGEHRPTVGDDFSKNASWILAYAGDGRDWSDAGIELSTRGAASRVCFESFLAAMRRDDIRFSAWAAMGWAEEWGQRHRGKLEFLRKDADAADDDRRLLAKICLGEDDGEGPAQFEYWLDETKTFTLISSSGDSEFRWDMDPEEFTRLLTTPVKMSFADKISVAQLTQAIETGANRTVLWYPEPPSYNEPTFRIKDYGGGLVEEGFGIGSAVCVACDMAEKQMSTWPDPETPGEYGRYAAFFGRGHILMVWIPWIPPR